MKQRLLVFFALLLISLAGCRSRPPYDMPIQTEATPATRTDFPTTTLTASATPTPSATITPTATATATDTPTPTPSFSFVVTSDMSYTNSPDYVDYPNFFKALLDYVAVIGPGDFMVSTGDVIRAADTRWSIDAALGKDYLWFPVIGNHDFGTEDLHFLQNYDLDPNGAAEPNLVNLGPDPCPKTTYSFDYQNAHFVVLNVYCNAESAWGIDGSISDTIYDWLAADLAATSQPLIFVFGHEPAFPQPDAQTGYQNHRYESLDQYSDARDRFWALLQDRNVVAYVNGHTHSFSAVQIGGVWQLDAGHSMGTRAGPTPGTFLIINIQGNAVQLQVYRGENGPGFSYELRLEESLRP